MKKVKDFIDTFVTSVRWKIGNFSILPVFFGTVLSLGDIAMMNTAKMVQVGHLNPWIGLPISVSSYSLVAYLFYRGLSYEGMVVTNLVWNMMSNIIVTLSGIFLFGETIKGIRWVGIGMGLIALGILSYTDD
jgi:drug/metabolite transporter (DMT)-like permease